jgi:uncharacterized protein YjiS (DUF1127 family)
MSHVDFSEAGDLGGYGIPDGRGWFRLDYDIPRTFRPHYKQITCPTTTKSTAEQIAELRQLLAEQDERRRKERELSRMLSAARHEAGQEIERQIAAVSAAIKSTPAAELAAIFRRLI